MTSFWGENLEPATIYTCNSGFTNDEISKVG
jgi:hypothetical protein